ncbi:MAG TPA: CPBP family intramembrane glutamic endopeptidase [Bryobacteraceae bacterium]|nr:CPBP family intramembrane glutamic endopeptidase [Bryobacteraceae bacterium]
MIFWALPLFWLACATAGYVYGLQRGIPFSVVLAALPAFLLEATLFLSLGVESWRKRLERLRPAGVAALLVVAAIAPYCAASLAFGSFRWQSLAGIALLSGLVAFWYVVLPQKPAADLLLLVLLAGVVLTHVFASLYVRPDPRLPLEALGQAMWIRTGAFALLSVRRVQGVGFGFWPSAREWKIGAVFFGLMLPVVTLLAWWIGWGKFHPPEASWIRTPVIVVLTFFGGLWVLALGEEFFFRGLLQQWIGGWLRNEWAGLIATSLLFGAVHLPYGAFPNWRFAVLASVAGVFYGLAFRHAGSIRASMVTHALTITTVRVFFS